LAVCGEALPESKGPSKGKNVKTNTIIGITHYVDVAAPWVVLGGRPSAKRIPFIYRFVFVPINEINEHHKAESLQHVQSFKLARVHVGVDIHQKDHIGNGQVLGEVLDRAPRPNKQKSTKLNHVLIEKVGVVQRLGEVRVEAHEG